MALFSSFALSLSICFRLTKCSRLSSPAFRIITSTKSTPTTDPIAETRTYRIHQRLSRFELTSAISSRSLPKGRTRNDESRALKRKRPNTPILRNNRNTHRVVLTMSSGLIVFSKRQFRESCYQNFSHKEAQKAQNQQNQFELFVLLCGRKIFEAKVRRNYYGRITTLLLPKLSTVLSPPAPDTGVTPSNPCTIARRVMIRGSAN